MATLDEAMTDPAVLDRMDLPGQSPYGTTRAALLASPTKIGVLLDSGLRYFSPRMRLLQRSLAGKNLTILYRDPADQRDRFAEALGARLGKVGALGAADARSRRCCSPTRSSSSRPRHALFLFRPEFPLLYARMKQLRGEIADAIQDYVTFRFAERPTLMDRKTPMPPEVQQAIDVYATYFLGICHLDQKQPRPQARVLLREDAARCSPSPAPGQPYYNMFRWGAQANLARLLRGQGRPTPAAIAYYAADDPTTQRHGNLLRARDLVWRDPTAPAADPPPPPGRSRPRRPRRPRRRGRGRRSPGCRGRRRLRAARSPHQPRPPPSPGPDVPGR